MWFQNVHMAIKVYGYKDKGSGSIYPLAYLTPLSPKLHWRKFLNNETLSHNFEKVSHHYDFQSPIFTRLWLETNRANGPVDSKRGAQ